MLRNAWTLARKDLRLFFRDRTALLLTLALPVLLATIFGSAMGAMMGGGGGSGGGAQELGLLVEDLDGSPASARLVELIDASSGLAAILTTDARRQVASGKHAAAFVIEPGYGAALERGDVPELRLLRDPSRTLAQHVIAGNMIPVLIESSLHRIGPSVVTRVLAKLSFPDSGRAEAEGLLTGAWGQMNDILLRSAFSAVAGAQAQVQAKAQAEIPAPKTERPSDSKQVHAAELNDSDDSRDTGGFDFLEDVPGVFGVVTEDIVGTADDSGGLPRNSGGSHAIAAIAVMMLMFSLTAAGGTLMEEHEGGTLLRLQLAPSAGSAILGGKLITLGLIGLLQLCVLFIYGQLVFEVPVLETPQLLILISIGLLLASTGLGLLFATACRTRKQMEGLSTLVILVMSAVGGAWFPREITPDWFQTAGLFTITAYAMDAFHGVLWYGKGLFSTEELTGVWPQVLALYLMGFLLLAASFLFYRKRYVQQA